MGLGKQINAAFSRLFLNKDGEFSLTKVGIQVAAVGTAVVTLPASLAAAGLAIAIPPAIIAGAKLSIIIGGALAGVGGRDAMDKQPTKKEN